MIEITRPTMTLMLDGVEISRHRSEVEAMESAAQNGAGVYTLVRPDATIVVDGVSEPEPTPDPAPDPVEPPSEPVDPPVGPGGVIFETNFGNDTGFSSVDSSPAYETETVPWGWDATKGGAGDLEVLSGEGVSGSNAMRIHYPGRPTAVQPTRSLFKHLTGDIDTGFGELYIRYHVRLPDTMVVGNEGGSASYWKWLRLWQNTNPDPAGLVGRWTENREDSHYIVVTWGGSLKYGIYPGVTAGVNSGTNLESGSSGGPRVASRYYDGIPPDFTADPACFESMGGGDWGVDRGTNYGRFSTYPAENQGYHTLEYRLRAATSETSNDGLFEVWFDGVKQPQPPKWRSRGNISGETPLGGIPTTVMGSGWNAVTIFDNMAEWNHYWDEVGVEGGVFLNDIVISTERIGHAYVAGNTDNA